MVRLVASQKWPTCPWLAAPLIASRQAGRQAIPRQAAEGESASSLPECLATDALPYRWQREETGPACVVVAPFPSAKQAGEKRRSTKSHPGRERGKKRAAAMLPSFF